MAGWPHVDWHDPIVIALVVVIAVVALWRRWAIVLLAALVVGMGQGLDYLLRHAAVSPAFAQNAVAGIYLVGGLLLAFLLVARFVTKR